MSSLEKSIFNIGYLETLALKRTFIHNIDPRIKLLTTIFYIVCIVSFEKYVILDLIPFFLFPVILIILGDIPPAFILKKIIVASPFILLIAVFNLILDTKTIMIVGIPVSAGWISFISIIIRFILTVFTSFTLIAVTGFYPLCLALQKIKVPSIFAIQLLLVYRYTFVLIEEAYRMVRAHNLRSFQNKMKIATFTSLISQLLLRTIDRAERIYFAMLSRGFDGTIHISRELKLCRTDILFMLFWISYFLAIRFIPVPYIIGKLITGWKL